MSYASVAAKNIPHSEQPSPDPVLSNDDNSSSEAARRKENAKKRIQEAEEEGLQLWETVKQCVLRPSVAGGLVGIVNIGLLSLAGRIFYINPQFRRDPAAISSTVAVAVVVASAEGYLAEKYHRTPEGKEAERRARQEGSYISRQFNEHVLRPGYLGGLVGVANVGILGTVGYFAYKNWDTQWDTHNVAAIAAGLITLWAGEALAVEQFSKTPEGQRAQKRAKEEGSEIYKNLNEAIWRPGVMGGMLGLLNAGSLAALGYYAYIHWDEPIWDPRAVSTAALAILSIWAGEGYVAKHYRDNY